MRTTHPHVGCVLAVIAICIAGGVNRNIYAQQPASAPPLMVGVSGTTEVGGAFQGTFLLSRFDTLPNNNGLAAAGGVEGVVNGRSIVTKVAIPVTVVPSSTLRTDGMTSPVSCDSVRIWLERSAFRALGSVVTLARSGIDVTAPQTSTPGGGSASSSPLAPLVTPGTLVPPAASGVGTLGAFPTAGMTSTATAAGSAVPTAPVGSATPGVISPAPQTNPSVTTSLQQLGQLICSVSRLSQSSAPPAQLADALNQVMLALHQ